MMNETVSDIFDSLKYVSRGGQKLAKALDVFDISPQGRVCIDCGASTGGFTDCLLQRGAKFVYAVDVGYGQLAWSLRNDPRVKVMERTNIRNVTADMLCDAQSPYGLPSLAVIDVSFISLKPVLPVVMNLGVSEVVCLIKPQFEAGKGKVGKGGVVREPKIHEEVLEAFTRNAENAGYIVKALSYSPVKGPKGNIEFIAHLTAGENIQVKPEIKVIVAEAHKDLDK